MMMMMMMTTPSMCVCVCVCVCVFVCTHCAIFLCDRVFHRITYGMLETAGPKTRVNNLVSALKSCLEYRPSFVDIDAMKERLQTELLNRLGVNVSMWEKREIKLRTKMYFVQSKFNLMREESEGYAKLAVALTKFCGAPEETEKMSLSFTDYVMSIIGYFNLDPNRVLDVCLDVFEHNLENESMIAFLKSFEPASITQIIAFKCDQYARSSSSEESSNSQGNSSEDSRSPVPRSLMHMAAMLIKHGIVDVDKLYARLSPTDDVMSKAIEERRVRDMQVARKIGKVALNASATDRQVRRKEEQEEREQLDALSTMLSVNNAKLALAEGLFRANCTDVGVSIIRRLAPVDPGALPDIQNALSNYVSCALDESVARDCFPENSFDVLLLLGPHLGKSPRVMCTVCRRLCRHLDVVAAKKKDKASDATDNDAADFFNADRLERILSRCLLPALMLLKSSFAMSLEVWNIMEKLPFTARFQIYGSVEKLVAQSESPDVVTAHANAFHETKRVMRRITKDNTKELGKKLGKYTHSTPLAVLSVIVNQIESYSQMIEPVVESFRQLSPLAFDVLTFVVMVKLASSGRFKLKDNGMDISDWMQHLSVFCGQMCSSYSKVTVSALLQYLANQLKSDESIDLLVLKELVSRMSGIISCEDLSEAQISALSLGENLKKLIASSLSKRERKMDSLQSALNEIGGLQLTLLVLIARQRTVISYNEEVSHLKLVGELYDKCQETLLQYVEFCQASLGFDAYAAMLPSFTTLVEVYKLESEVALMMYRPLMRRLLLARGGDDVVSVEISGGQKVTLVNLHAEVRKCALPAGTWAGISIHLYVTFWALSLEDLEKSDAYDVEIAKLKAAMEGVGKRPEDRAKEKREKCQREIQILEKEFEAKEEDYASASIRMKSLKNDFMKGVDREIAADVFLQQCVVRRCIFSPADSLYCARFIERLIAIETPFFSVLAFYSGLFRSWTVPLLLESLTAHEASRLGRYLNQTMAKLTHLASSEEVYEKEIKKKMCYARAWTEDVQTPLSYEEFRKTCETWFQRLRKKTVDAIQSGTFHEMRNSFLVLQKIIKYFPFWSGDYDALRSAITEVIGKEKREDLKLMARSYLSMLGPRKSKLIPSTLEVPQSQKSLPEVKKEADVDTKSLPEVKKEADVDTKSAPDARPPPDEKRRGDARPPPDEKRRGDARPPPDEKRRGDARPPPDEKRRGDARLPPRQPSAPMRGPPSVSRMGERTNSFHRNDSGSSLDRRMDHRGEAERGEARREPGNQESRRPLDLSQMSRLSRPDESSDAKRRRAHENAPERGRGGDDNGRQDSRHESKRGRSEDSRPPADASNRSRPDENDTKRRRTHDTDSEHGRRDSNGRNRRDDNDRNRRDDKDRTRREDNDRNRRDDKDRNRREDNDRNRRDDKDRNRRDDKDRNRREDDDRNRRGDAGNDRRVVIEERGGGGGGSRRDGGNSGSRDRRDRSSRRK